MTGQSNQDLGIPRKRYVQDVDVLGLQIPGAGRGIVALRNISYGEVVHREQPVLCVPATGTLDKV